MPNVDNRPDPRLSAPSADLAVDATGNRLAEPSTTAEASKRLIGHICELSRGGTGLTLQQSAEFQQKFRALIDQGPRAVPAIREFLAHGKDFQLDQRHGSTPVGYTSIRAAFFDALRQIGGPESESALLESFHLTDDPAEISAVARHLDELAPGAHRDATLAAATNTLAQIARSQTRPDVGPLFQILARYGGPEVAGQLQQFVPQWQHYGLIALAELADGQGLPALIKEAEISNRDSARATFALRMLAQLACARPEARAALLNQARAGRVPDRAWRRIGEALAGDQFQLGSHDEATSGAKTHHIASAREKFYSISVPPAFPGAELEQRRQLINDLLAVPHSSQAAAEALERARNELMAVAP